MNTHLHHPFGVFVSNGEVFICDKGNNCVRKLLRNGQIVTIVGGNRTSRKEEEVKFPMSVVVSSSNQVYISEKSRIRKIDQNDVISTIAGTGVSGYNGDNQLAVDAQLCNPRGLFVTDEEEVFFCDRDNHRVRKIDRFGIISTVAGTGECGYNGDDILATSAKLYEPISVFVHRNEIYIADRINNRIRKVLQNGIIKTIAGTGVNGYNGYDQPATSAKLSHPYGLFVHNDYVYISDYYNYRIRKILPNGIIQTIAGTGIRSGGFDFGDGKLATESNLRTPVGIFVDDSGIYITCNDDARVRKIDSNGILATIVGTGVQGYSGDVPFDFEKYPHIGPKKKQLIKPFPKSYHDLTVFFTLT